MESIENERKEGKDRLPHENKPLNTYEELGRKEVRNILILLSGGLKGVSFALAHVVDGELECKVCSSGDLARLTGRALR